MPMASLPDGALVVTSGSAKQFHSKFLCAQMRMALPVYGALMPFQAIQGPAGLLLLIRRWPASAEATLPDQDIQEDCSCYCPDLLLCAILHSIRVPM